MRTPVHFSHHAAPEFCYLQFAIDFDFFEKVMKSCRLPSCIVFTVAFCVLFVFTLEMYLAFSSTMTKNLVCVCVCGTLLHVDFLFRIAYWK